MKNLIFIGGTMGIGKTTVGKILKNGLNHCVFLDGDWCWDMEPFKVNEETKTMVLDNITHLLRNFIDCTEFENIVFVWVMHEQKIIDTLISMLGSREYQFYNFSLVCSPEILRERLNGDVKNGIRTINILRRSISRLPLYKKIDSIKINTDTMSAVEVADCIAKKICVLQTDRLSLREMNKADFPALCKMLQDTAVMYAYEHAFSDEEAQEWLDRQLGRYQQYGFGLWAVTLSDTGEMIGQCGLTMQGCDGKEVLEVGYLFQKEFWHKGYATEAAIACKKYAFKKIKASEVFSIIRDNNVASQNVAKRNGMTVCGRFTKHYYDIDMPHLVYSVKKEDK